MAEIPSEPTSFKVGGNLYAAGHWEDLSPFLIGEERDPKGLFTLSSDVWEAWPYADRGRPTEAIRYRFRFGHLRSFLKPYLKRYCFLKLIGSGEKLKTGAVVLPRVIPPADRYIADNNYRSLDDLALPGVIDAVWESLLSVPGGAGAGRKEVELPPSAFMAQGQTASFWKYLKLHYGAPLYVPPTPGRRKKHVVVAARADASKLIPDAVMRQLVNKLALHRDRVATLNRYHHLRLCVLLLHICLGRRMEEILGSPRGKGPDGPLHRYPRRHDGEQSEDALWFEFNPNKGGPSDVAYVSPEWEDLAYYCVRHLARYSDEVRHLAAREERGLLILVSTLNWTYYRAGNVGVFTDEHKDFVNGGVLNGPRRKRDPRNKYRTRALGYDSFRTWLHGRASLKDPERSIPGIMERWNITRGGSAEGPVYRLLTHLARHTRQSAIARDPAVTLLTRQRDLNHSSPDTQLVYQHIIEEQNRELIGKVEESPLAGQDMYGLQKLLGIEVLRDAAPGGRSAYGRGLITLLSPRVTRLLEEAPEYFEKNVVSLGICDLPDGPCNLFGGKLGKKAP